MLLPCLNLTTCLLCLPFRSKSHSKPTTAIFTSGTSSSMTFERIGQCEFACNRRIGVGLIMQRRTVVVVMSRHRKVRRMYAARTQCIHLDTPMVKIIRHSITADTLWVRKVRYRYVVASLHTPHICEPLRTCSVSATIAFDAVTLPWRTVRFEICRTYASRFVNVLEQYYFLT